MRYIRLFVAACVSMYTDHPDNYLRGSVARGHSGQPRREHAHDLLVALFSVRRAIRRERYPADLLEARGLERALDRPLRPEMIGKRTALWRNQGTASQNDARGATRSRRES